MAALQQELDFIEWLKGQNRHRRQHIKTWHSYPELHALLTRLPQRCHYCSVAVTYSRRDSSGLLRHASLDRIVPGSLFRREDEPSYRPDNIVIACRWCNSVRSNATQQNFEAFLAHLLAGGAATPGHDGDDNGAGDVQADVQNGQGREDEENGAVEEGGIERKQGGEVPHHIAFGVEQIARWAQSKRSLRLLKRHPNDGPLLPAQDACANLSQWIMDELRKTHCTSRNGLTLHTCCDARCLFRYTLVLSRRPAAHCSIAAAAADSGEAVANREDLYPWHARGSLATMGERYCCQVAGNEGWRACVAFRIATLLDSIATTDDDETAAAAAPAWARSLANGLRARQQTAFPLTLFASRSLAIVPLLFPNATINRATLTFMPTFEQRREERREERRRNKKPKAPKPPPPEPIDLGEWGPNDRLPFTVVLADTSAERRPPRKRARAFPPPLPIIDLG